jgi:hypothetical protein
MLTLAALIFQYRLFILAGLMLAWCLSLSLQASFTRHPAFRSAPLVFAVLMFAQVFYSPISITVPTDPAIVHAGDKVILKIELTPKPLSRLYPFVNVSFYSCAACADSPVGISAQGALTGSPYSFVVNIPKNQPRGEIFVDAYASSKMGDHAALRSKSIGLVIEPIR